MFCFVLFTRVQLTQKQQHKHFFELLCEIGCPCLGYFFHPKVHIQLLPTVARNKLPVERAALKVAL